MKRALVFVSILALSSFIFFTPPAQAKQKPDFVPGELLVQPKAWAGEAQVQAALKKHGAEVKKEIEQIKVKLISVPDNALDKIRSAMSKNPVFSFVEPNYLAKPVYTPNDDRYPDQWHLPDISAPSGWDLSFGDSEVPIAIIDSGVDPDHPDLSNKLMTGHNFIDDTTDTADGYGHGTGVAGSSAAMSDNVTGVAGIAWQNPIMPLMVLNSDGTASYSDIAEAITYAVDNGARVMNISLSGSSSSYTLQNAVDYAWNNGAVIVASAGNDSTDTPYYPAACEHAVAVSATDSSSQLAYFSNYGSWIDVCAPGVSILTTNNSGGYGDRSGTSFSSPITAGVVALMVSANPSLSNSQVVQLLQESADDLGERGFDTSFGHGKVNVYAAVDAAMNAESETDTTAPTVSVSSPDDGATVSGSTTISASASDDVGVDYVEFYLDGAFFASDSSSPYSVSWDTTTASDGSHDIAAEAVDTSGNVGVSSTVTVTVDNTEDTTDTQAPSVTMVIDKIGNPKKPKYKVEVQGFDDVGVTKVELYLDGTLVKTESGSSLKWMWDTDNGDAGTHTLTGKAYDSAGNVGQTSQDLSI